MASRFGRREIYLDSLPYTGAGRFRAFILEGKHRPTTGILLLHGRRSNPDNGPVIGHLRRALNDVGYTTISVACPAPDPDEFPNYAADASGDNLLFTESFARVRAAMSALARIGIFEVVLLGFGMGARMQSAFLSADVPSILPVRGFIALGNGTNGTGMLDCTNTLPGVLVPVLDAFGGGDAHCVEFAEARRTAYESGIGISFTQVAIGDDAPHSFDGNERQLESIVLGWMDKTAPGVAV